MATYREGRDWRFEQGLREGRDWHFDPLRAWKAAGWQPTGKEGIGTLRAWKAVGWQPTGVEGGKGLAL